MTPDLPLRAHRLTAEATDGGFVLIEARYDRVLRCPLDGQSLADGACPCGARLPLGRIRVVAPLATWVGDLDRVRLAAAAASAASVARLAVDPVARARLAVEAFVSLLDGDETARATADRIRRGAWVATGDEPGFHADPEAGAFAYVDPSTGVITPYPAIDDPDPAWFAA